MNIWVNANMLAASPFAAKHAKSRYDILSRPNDSQSAWIWVGFHFGSKKFARISIVFEDLSRNSVFFQTEVKP